MADVTVFSMPKQQALGARLAMALGAGEGVLTVRDFPDGETYVRGETTCAGGIAILVANLFQPNPLILPVIYSGHALRERGAQQVVLVCPYLPYMRQDAQFRAGEVVTSRIFAGILNDAVDGLVTVDPHLHRYQSLGEIYSIATRIAHAAPALAGWIRRHVDRPLIVGPDGESAQWVNQVADLADAPSMVLSKERRGDRDVAITVPSLERWRGHTPVLIDDIISTAHTMIEAARHLLKAGYAAPVCIGVHAIFAGDAYGELKRAGAATIITCNTVPHPSNAIDLTDALASGARDLTQEYSK